MKNLENSFVFFAGIYAIFVIMFFGVIAPIAWFGYGLMIRPVIDILLILLIPAFVFTVALHISGMFK